MKAAFCQRRNLRWTRKPASTSCRFVSASAPSAASALFRLSPLAPIRRSRQLSCRHRRRTRPRRRTILGQIETERQGERLKSRHCSIPSPTTSASPLTSMKAAVSSLLTSEYPDPAQRKELLTIIDEECDRLNHLVEEAGEMAKLEAGEVELALEPTKVSEIMKASLANSKTSLSCREIIVNVDDSLPLLKRRSRTHQRSRRPVHRQRESLLAKRSAHHHHRWNRPATSSPPASPIAGPASTTSNRP